MKTIEVSDEDYDFLMDLSKEMNTQDNRGTADVMFTVFQKKKIYGLEAGYTDNEVLIDDNDSDGPYEFEDLVRIINDWNEDMTEEDEDFTKFECYHHDKHMCPECIEGNHSAFDNLPEGWRWVGYQVNSEVFVDNFLTDKAAQQHIDSNHYHYTDPYVYGSSAWRNPEMNNVQRILKSLNPEKK